MKKSDIDTFEIYLDSYLKVLKKFRQNSRRYRQKRLTMNKNKNSTISKNFKNSKNSNSTDKFKSSQEKINITLNGSQYNNTISKSKKSRKNGTTLNHKNKTENISNSILNFKNFTNKNSTLKEKKEKNSTNKIKNYNSTKSTSKSDLNTDLQTGSVTSVTNPHLKENKTVSIHNSHNKTKLSPNNTLLHPENKNISSNSQVKNSSSVSIPESSRNNFTEKINEFLLGSDYKNRTARSQNLTDYLENYSKYNKYNEVLNKTEDKINNSNTSSSKNQNSLIEVKTKSTKLNSSTKIKKIPLTRILQTEERKNFEKSAKKADHLINDQISNPVSNFSSKKKKHSRNSRSFLSNPEEIDKIYQNLKKTKLNEEFERREKQTEGSNLESASSKYIDTVTVENNIYKRIINISF